MTVQLKQLLVTADLNAAGYARGAQQKKAADDAMVQSGRQALFVFQETDSKLSQSGDVLARLSRQYVDGFANAQKFATAVNSLTGGVERGRIEISQASAILDGIYRKYGMMADATKIAERGQLELANAVERANARFQQQRNIVPANDSVAGFRRQNLGYQAFDIGQGVASGMPLPLIAAQQLPQVAQLYAGAGGMKAALGDAAALATGAVTAIGAIPLALGVAGTAAILYAKRNEVSLKTADDALARHRSNIEALGAAYGVAEQRAKSYSDADRAVASASTQGSLQDLNKLQVQAARELRLQFGSMQTPGKGGQAFFAPFPDYKPFFDAFRDLDSGIRSGRVEGEKFVNTVSQIAKINPQFEVFSNNILKASEQFLKINKEALETQAILTQISKLPPLDPLGAFDQQRIQDDRARRTPSQFQQRLASEDASRQQTFARTLAEKEAAARAVAAAQFDPNENPSDREHRIARAALETRLAGERQLQDAQRARVVSMARMLADQQNEISLIGKTGGELVALRKEYELTSQLRLEAAQQGIAVDERELALIKEKTRALGTAADQYNRRRFDTDLQREISDARLNDRQRQIVTTLRQYGLPEDLNSGPAQQLGQQMDWQQAKDTAKSFGNAFRDEMVSGSHDLGKSFLKGFEASLLNGTAKIWDNLIDKVATGFADWVIGSKSGGGGLGGALGAGATSIATKAMAATSVVANDNTPSLGLAGSALGFVGNYKSGVDARLTDILQKASGSFPGFKVDAISGFRAGDPRFHGKGLATDVRLTDLASGKMLGNYQDAGSFGAYERFAQTARAIQMRDYPELNDKFRWGGYFSGGKGKYGALDTMHFDVAGAGMGGGSWDRGLTSAQRALWPGAQSNGIDSASAAVNKLAEASGDATINLGGFGKGVGALGSTLQSIPQALMANGGGGGLLSSLTKYGLGLFGGSAQFASAWLKGGVGLFADGTESAPGGLAMVGERGREYVNLPRGSQVIPNHRTESMLAANRNAGNGGSQGRAVPLNVTILGASGDQHVMKLVEQGVASGLDLYSKEMERSGSNTQQQRYALRRG